VSFTKKVVTTYSKSLFQNVNSSKTSPSTFEVSKITSADQKSLLPNVYIIGEELLLMSSTLLSSKKVKEFFCKSDICRKTKIRSLIKYFPRINNHNKIFFKSFNRTKPFISNS